MTQLFVAAPTLVRSKAARIILPALIVVVAMASFGTMFGVIVETRLYMVIALSTAASLLAGAFHERLVTLAKQLDAPAD
ncbi:MAG: hypothetical protein ACFHXK_03860 [bacterium]